MTDTGVKRRILVVEDDAATAVALVKVLTTNGCDVLAAQDGAAGVRAAHEGKPDLVLTDIGLPGMDGFGVLEALQTKLPEIPVIVMTGAGEVASAVRAMRAGADNYLEKPIDIDVLTLAVDRALEARRQRAEAESFFALSIDMLCIAGFDGYFKRLNVAWERTLGWSTGELLSRPASDFVHPDDRRAADEERNKLMSGGESLSFECRYRCKDGSHKWLMWNAAAIRGTQTIHAVVRDVTEKKRADAEIRTLVAQLQQRGRQLEEANKELDGFSYSVSHDLRAPLRAIHEFAHILIEDHAPQLDADGRHAAEAIGRNTRKMQQLIDDLLAFSKWGRHAIRARMIDMAALVREVAEEARRGAGPGRRVEIRIGDLPGAPGDPELLRQVWANLLDNAVKYTRPRNPAVIEVRGQRSNTEVIYTVADNGVGFDPRYASKLFGVFQRLHSASEFEGTGVGLALAHRIVQRHGGWLRAQSSVGTGATFSFALPTVAASES